MNIKERYAFNPELNILAKRAGVSTYISHDKLLQRSICLKIFQVGRDESEQLVEAAKKAILFFHPNLCSYYDVLEQESTDTFGITQKSILLVSEYIQEGDIKQNLHQFTEKESQIKLFVGIANALQYLHEHGSYHLNLHPGNVFIKAQQHELVAKLSDYLPLNALSKSIIAQYNAQHNCYKAPELFKDLNDNEQLKKADFWSLGVIMYELITGKRLFYEPTKRMEQIIQSIAFERIDFTEIKDNHYRYILEKLLQRNPKNRPESAQEIIELLTNPPIEALSHSPVLPISNNAILIPVIEKQEIVKPTETSSTKPKDAEILAAPFLEATPPVSEEEQKSVFWKEIRIPIMGVLLLGLFSMYLFVTPNTPKLQLTYNTKLSAGLPLPEVNISFTQIDSNEIMLQGTMETASAVTQPAPMDFSAPTAIANPTHIASPTQYTVNTVPQTVPKTAEITALTNAARPSIYLPPLDMIYEQVYPVDLNGKYMSINPTVLECLNQKAQIKEIGRNLFLVKPSETGEITLLFKDKLTNETLDARSYFVNNRPDPKAFVGNDLRNTNATKNMILAKQGLQLVSPSDPSVRITSFRMRIDNAEVPFEATSNSSLFQQEMMEKIKSAKPGQKIVFDRIRVSDSKGGSMNVNDIYITVSPY